MIKVNKSMNIRRNTKKRKQKNEKKGKTKTVKEKERERKRTAREDKLINYCSSNQLTPSRHPSGTEEGQRSKVKCRSRIRSRHEK